MKHIYLITLCFLSLQSIAQSPVISSFTPSLGAAGTVVSVKGKNFHTTVSVSFGNVPATSFTVHTDSTLSAVVGIGGSGQVRVTNLNGSAVRSGFSYLTTSRIISDFRGYWTSTTSSPNSLKIDTNHNLLAFTYNNIMYSTGANDAILTANGLSFTPGEYHALPVAGITGQTSTSSNSTYITLAEKVDGSASVAVTPAVSHLSVRDVLVDGVNGLDLGTGITNLPTSAVLRFPVSIVHSPSVDDNEPDFIITQIAQPVSGNDVFTLEDAAGNMIGTPFTQDMTLLAKFGSYDLDLFNLVPGTPYNIATAYSVSSTSTNREIRVVAIRLSDFGITAANAADVKALKITPSGNSDYAFIAYNSNSIDIPPNVSWNDGATNTSVCSGGIAKMAVVATGSMGGALSYNWERSADGGITWQAVSNGGNYSGAQTAELSATNPSAGEKFRVLVTESGNIFNVTSLVFTITIISPTPPSSVLITGNLTTCLNSAVQLTSTVVGGSNLAYQWQSNASGSFLDIPGATYPTYVPPVNQTGVRSYRLRVTSGHGCTASLTSADSTITVTGISTTTNAERCLPGSVTLQASATSGTIDWYNTDAGGSVIHTGNSFTTPSLSATRTYYVSSTGCAGALRVPVTATIYQGVAGGVVNGSGNVVIGLNNSVLTLTGVVGTVVKWQSSTHDFLSNIVDIPGSEGKLSITITDLLYTTWYRAIVSNGVCGEQYSVKAKLTVIGVVSVLNNNIKAHKVSGGIQVQFSAMPTGNTAYFEVLRSANGIDFYSVKKITPSENAGLTEYAWLDTSPLQGNNYYRIREIYNQGQTSLSSIVMVYSGKAESRITIHPNTIEGRLMRVQFISMPAGKYSFRFTNTSGQVMDKLTVTHSGENTTLNIPVSYKITAGNYQVEVISKEGDRLVFRIAVK